MLYPTISEYISSIKDAENNFDKRANLRPLINTNGDPIFTSGNFAVVFKMKDTRTNKYYAVKSFIKDQERRAESYKLISKELQNVTSPYLVKYEYLDKELFVDSSQSKETEYPVVVMDWIEGKTLDAYVKDLCESEDKNQLESLSARFNQLATWLLEQPFAHGDLKHDNILVRQDGSLVLVDYDGMYVPAMEGQKARELGSPDYRHPKRTADSFNANIDLFPLITIALALKALSLKPDLYKKYNPKDHLLFTEKDFNDSANSVRLKEISTLIYDKPLAGLYSAFLFCLHFSTEKKTIFDIFRISSYKNTNFEELCKLRNIVNDHPEWFLEVISGKYHLSEDLIEQYKDYWNWHKLSCNESLLWSLELIDKYKDRWNWNGLSQNKSLPCFIGAIEEFKNKGIKNKLSMNESHLWSLELIENNKNRWNWEVLSENEYLPWSIELIEKYIDRWNWNRLSSNSSLPWSLELIEEFKDKWDWEDLSRNKSLPWPVELIEEFKDKWKWENLSLNISLPWSIELIEKYKDKWNWGKDKWPWDFFGLSINESLPWSLELIETFKDKWKWGFGGLSSNKSLPWSLELIEKYKDKWNWDHGDIGNCIGGLSSNKSLPWTLELIEKYKDKWNWKELSENVSIPWSLELIEKYKDKWEWFRLSRNEFLPWSLELIEKFKYYWDWEELSKNVSIPFELLEKGIVLWDWEYLSDNGSLPWSLELIEKYKDQWDWFRLSCNEFLPWSLELIEKYKDKWNWNCFMNNSTITNIFKDLPSSTIDELMQTITNK